MSTTRALKKTLRKEIAARLAALDSAALARQSATAHATLRTLLAQHFPPGTPLAVGLYASMPSGELQTDPLVAALLADPAGHRVYLPRIEPLAPWNEPPRFARQRTALRFVHVAAWPEYAALQAQGPYALREPQIRPDRSNDLFTAHDRLDVLVVPGVAFSEGLTRLGHGAGFYDDFIKRYRSHYSNSKPLLVGIALPDQLVDAAAIPMEEHDEALDYLVVEDKIYTKT